MTPATAALTDAARDARPAFGAMVFSSRADRMSDIAGTTRMIIGSVGFDPITIFDPIVSLLIHKRFRVRDLESQFQLKCAVELSCDPYRSTTDRSLIDQEATKKDELMICYSSTG